MQKRGGQRSGHSGYLERLQHGKVEKDIGGGKEKTFTRSVAEYFRL